MFPDLRAEAKPLGLKRYSRLRKQDFIQLISQFQKLMFYCWHQQRYLVFKPQVNESEQQRNRGDALRQPKKAIPKIKVSSPEEGKREGKIGGNKEIDRKSIQLRIDKQPLH